MSEVASAAGTANHSAGQLHALTVISGALHRELKEIAGRLQAFTDSARSNPISSDLAAMQRASSFCGFWGPANMLGALRELSAGIESSTDVSVDRSEHLERVKTLAGGITALGLYLRDMSEGVSVSYAALNEQFAKVLRKARPQLLEVPPAQTSAMLFMAVPPSLEVDALWRPRSGASRAALMTALDAFASQAISPETLDQVAAANPYRSLAGLLEVAASQPALFDDEHVGLALAAEYTRIGSLLSEERSPGAPLTPDAFLFSRLLHALSSGADSPRAAELRKRYSLLARGAAQQDGSTTLSMHEVARRFATGMSKFADAYKQAALTRTPAPVVKLAHALVSEAQRLQSPAFSTLAATLHRHTVGWSAENPPDFEAWTHGAALIVLLSESAAAWGVEACADELAGIADIIAGTGQIIPCPTMQRASRVAAVRKACSVLVQECAELKVAIEGSLRSVDSDSLSPSEGARIAESVGSRVAATMSVLAGLCQCVGLPAAAAAATELREHALNPQGWAEPEARSYVFERVARLSAFIGRLRPGSLIDLQPEELAAERAFDEDGDLSGANAAQLEVADEVVVAESVVTDSVDKPSDTGPTEAIPSAEACAGAEAAPELADVQAAESRACLGTGAADAADLVPEMAPQDQVEQVERALDDDDLFGAAGAVARKPAFSEEELTDVLLHAAENEVNQADVGDAELMHIMLEEADECLAAIDACLSPWHGQPAASQQLVGTVNEARRHVHTLKGVCRTCGLMAAGGILHAMEDRLELTEDDGQDLGPDVAAYRVAMAAVRAAIDDTRSLIYAPAPAVDPEPVATESAAAVVAHVDTTPTALSDEQSDGLLAAEPPLAAEDLAGHPAPQSAHLSAAAAASRPPKVDAGSEAARQPARSQDATVRVPLRLAGKLSAATGLIAAATRRSVGDADRSARDAREVEAALGRMAPLLRELDKLAAASITSGAGASPQGFDALELDRFTALQELVIAIREAFDDSYSAARQLNEGLRSKRDAEDEHALVSEDLQRDANELMLVGVATQQARLERVMSKACEDTGKLARLVVDPECRVPAAAIDRLMPSLEHLLRNALAHGIELPREREARGKPAVGLIEISASREPAANAVRLVVRDDGAGIDADRVLSIAIKRGLAVAGTSYRPQAIHEFLFMPGFSTAAAVSGLAGRGVGLDVVRATMTGLGGAIGVTAQRGVGTEFTLTLPTDTASLPVIPVKAGGYACLLPLHLVTRIVPVSSAMGVHIDREAASVAIEGETLDLIDLASRVPTDPAGAGRRGQGHLVMMSEATRIVAVLVDHVGAQGRVLVRPLGPFVRDIPGLMAGTTFADGTVGLVINPLRLQSAAGPAPAATAAARGPKQVLIVDDSSTVRLVTSRLLKRLGYEVASARDGIEALQVLDDGASPSGFVVDLEMPGMGGFDLIREIRRRPHLQDAAIIVISSRSAPKHRERARDLGATAYLTKPYEEAQLRDLLARLVGFDG